MEAGVWLNACKLRTCNITSSESLHETLPSVSIPSSSFKILKPVSHEVFPRCDCCWRLLVRSIWKCSDSPVSELLPSPFTVFHYLMDTTSSRALHPPLERLWKHELGLYLQPQSRTGSQLREVDECETISAYQLLDFMESRATCVVALIKGQQTYHQSEVPVF